MRRCCASSIAGNVPAAGRAARADFNNRHEALEALYDDKSRSREGLQPMILFLWMPAIALSHGWCYVLSGMGLFVATFTISILVIGFLLVRLPATYFLDTHNRELWIDQHPLLRWTGIVAKNFLGVALVLLGVVLSVPGIPGQGLLTILIGLVLVDFPGKRRFERWILKRRGVLGRVNALRRRFGKPPLVLVDTGDVT